MGLEKLLKKEEEMYKTQNLDSYAENWREWEWQECMDDGTLLSINTSLILIYVSLHEQNTTTCTMRIRKLSSCCEDGWNLKGCL